MNYRRGSIERIYLLVEKKGAIFRSFVLSKNFVEVRERSGSFQPRNSYPHSRCILKCRQVWICVLRWFLRWENVSSNVALGFEFTKSPDLVWVCVCVFIRVAHCVLCRISSFQKHI